MQPCPVCQEPNPPEAKLCRRCGNVFRRADEAAGRRPLRLLLIVGAIVALPLFALAIRREATVELTYYGTKLYDKGPNFAGQEVRMKRVDASIHNGWIEIPLHVIEDAKLVEFQVPIPSMNMPMIAYIGPTGHLITAMAYCELCQTRGYHFESNTLVCDKCMTTWALEGDGVRPQHRPSHLGFAGNCRLFGPEFVENEVVDSPGGKLVRIKESRVTAWSPRTHDSSEDRDKDAH